MSRARAKLERLERDTAPAPLGDIVVELVPVELVPIGADGRPVDVFEVTTEHTEAEP